MISIRDRGYPLQDLSSVTIAPEPIPVVVTVPQVKNFAKIDFAEDDVIVDNVIQAIVDEAEQITRSLLSPRSVTAFYNRASNKVQAPYGPVVSVQSVTYIDANGVETPGTSRIQGDTIYLPDYPGGAVRIEFTAGYEFVPAGIKQAVLQAVTTAYEDRQDNVIGTGAVEIPSSSRKRLMKFRRF